MNLRTLKKLSKRAAPFLPVLGDDRKQFPAAKWENYAHTFISDRKHWDRHRVHPSCTPHNRWGSPRGEPILFVSREGRHILIDPPHHPRKGTIMVGATCGYYEPEWEEQCAWSALEDLVFEHFADYSDWENGPIQTRIFRNPSDILAAAAEMVAEQKVTR